MPLEWLIGVHAALLTGYRTLRYQAEDAVAAAEEDRGNENEGMPMVTGEPSGAVRKVIEEAARCASGIQAFGVYRRVCYTSLSELLYSASRFSFVKKLFSLKCFERHY